MKALTLVQTKDQYDPTLTLEDLAATTLRWTIADAAVRVQLRAARRESGSENSYSNELVIEPEKNTLPLVSGVKFKSAVAGVPAVINAILFGPDDPQIPAGIPFTQTLSPSGLVGAGAAPSYAKSANLVDITTPAGNVETDILNFPIKAVDINTSSQFEFVIRGDILNAVADSNLTIRAYIGATKVIDTGAFSTLAGGLVSGVRCAYTIRGSLSLRNALNSQWTELGGNWERVDQTVPVAGEGLIFRGNATNAGGVIGGGSAVDMTLDQTFRVSAFWAISDANHSLRKYSSLAVLY